MVGDFVEGTYVAVYVDIGRGGLVLKCSKVRGAECQISYEVVIVSLALLRFISEGGSYVVAVEFAIVIQDYLAKRLLFRIEFTGEPVRVV